MGSFENLARYRRKPETVRAMRLKLGGNIPIMHADQPWLKRLIAERRLVHSAGGWFAQDRTDSQNNVYMKAAYDGDWLVLHDATDRLEVVSDDRFRALYEGNLVEEEEDA